jgi:hypothetical protein
MATSPQTAPAPGKFQKLRQITLPVLKMSPGKMRYVAFIGPMHVGRELKGGKNVDPSKPKKEPAVVAHCLDMETGEEGTLICAAMLRSELDDNYPGGAYVGRGFEISHTRTPDRDYNIVSVCEVSVPDNIAASVAAIRKAMSGSATKAAKEPATTE